MMTCFYQASSAWQGVLLVISQFAVIFLSAGLILLFRRKRYGKFLFMTFTIILIIYQITTAEDHVWPIYFLELMMVVIMAPLKVFVTINKNIMEKVTDITNVEG